MKLFNYFKWLYYANLKAHLKLILSSHCVLILFFTYTKTTIENRQQNMSSISSQLETILRWSLNNLHWRLGTITSKMGKPIYTSHSSSGTLWDQYTIVVNLQIMVIQQGQSTTYKIFVVCYKTCKMQNQGKKIENCR